MAISRGIVTVTVLAVPFCTFTSSLVLMSQVQAAFVCPSLDAENFLQEVNLHGLLSVWLPQEISRVPGKILACYQLLL